MSGGLRWLVAVAVMVVLLMQVFQPAMSQPANTGFKPLVFHGEEAKKPSAGLVISNPYNRPPVVQFSSWNYRFPSFGFSHDYRNPWSIGR